MGKKVQEENEMVIPNEAGEVITPVEVKEMTESEKKVLFLAKKQQLRNLLQNYNFIKDGYNSQLGNEYVKAEQFRKALSDCASEVGLEYTINTYNSIFENIAKSEKMYLSTVIADVVLIDMATGYEYSTRVISTGADNLDKGIFKAYAMICKTYVQNEFGVISPNDMDAEADIKPTTDSKKFVTPAKKEEIIKEVVSKAEPKTEGAGELTTPEYLNNVKQVLTEIRKVEPAYGDKTLALIEKALETGVMPSQAEMVRKMLTIEKKFNEIGG